MLGRGLVPRLSIGTLQLSIRCSSIHFLPSRSFPVSPPGTFRDDLPGSRSGLQNSGVCPDLSTLFEGLVFTETLYLISQRRRTSACPSCGLQTSFVAKKSSSAPI